MHLLHRGYTYSARRPMRAPCPAILARTVWLALDPVSAQTPAPTAELDAFMAQVLVRRDENWKKVQQYILDEQERVEFRGPGEMLLWGAEARIHAGIRATGSSCGARCGSTGSTISESEREKYEQNFLTRTKSRDERARERGKETEGTADAAPSDLQSLIQQTREPQFVSSAYLLKFKFEGGRYALVGRETIDKQPVLRIEYYPTRLFSDDPGTRAEARANQVAGRKSRGRRVRRRDAAAHEQGVACDDVGRAESEADREVHVRQRRPRISSCVVARARHRAARQHDHDRGVSERVAAEAGRRGRVVRARAGSVLGDATTFSTRVTGKPRRPENISDRPTAHADVRRTAGSPRKRCLLLASPLAAQPVPSAARGRKSLPPFRCTATPSRSSDDIIRASGIAVGDRVSDKVSFRRRSAPALGAKFDSVDVLKRFASISDLTQSPDSDPGGRRSGARRCSRHRRACARRVPGRLLRARESCVDRGST